MKGKVTLPATIGLILAVALLFALQWKMELQWGAPAVARGQGTAAAAGVRGEGLDEAPPDTETPTTSLAVALQEEVRQRALQIGTPTEEPKLIEASLQVRGESLRPAEISALRDFLFQGSPTGDQAGLALDLLGRSNEKFANQTLLDYVLATPQNPSAEQSTLQLLALEGITDQAERSRAPEALRRLQKESTDPVVARRAAQALGALQGKNPWPRETDEKTLRELLEQTVQ